MAEFLQAFLISYIAKNRSYDRKKCCIKITAKQKSPLQFDFDIRCKTNKPIWISKINICNFPDRTVEVPLLSKEEILENNCRIVESVLLPEDFVGEIRISAISAKIKFNGKWCNTLSIIGSEKPGELIVEFVVDISDI